MPPNSALTRFIKQGLARGVCPLCRVAYKVDREYMWAFLDEYSGHDETLDRLRRARGFCAAHAEQLRRLEVEGLKSNLGISGVYLDTVEGLAEELRSLGPGSPIPKPAKCPACQYRDEEVERDARHLLDEVRDSHSSRERLRASEGLCFPHLRLVWERAGDPADRELLLELQRRVIANVANDLHENIRKQGHEYPGTPTEQETRSWERAIFLTVGWSREALRDPPPAPDERYQLPDYARVRPRGEADGDGA